MLHISSCYPQCADTSKAGAAYCFLSVSLLAIFLSNVGKNTLFQRLYCLTRVCTLEAVAALIHEIENDDHVYDELLRACQIKVGWTHNHGRSVF